MIEYIQMNRASPFCFITVHAYTVKAVSFDYLHYYIKD